MRSFLLQQMALPPLSEEERDQLVRRSLDQLSKAREEFSALLKHYRSKSEGHEIHWMEWDFGQLETTEHWGAWQWEFVRESTDHGRTLEDRQWHFGLYCGISRE